MSVIYLFFLMNVFSKVTTVQRKRREKCRRERKKLNHHKEIAHLLLREYTQPMLIFKEIQSKRENRPYVHPYADILG